jgi:glycolate oxidase FAD binding subunit
MTMAVVSSVDELRGQIMEAAERGSPLRVVGRGTWLEGGRPTVGEDFVSTRSLSGIVEYVPGDLTLTARAGTSLAEIHNATAEHGQWLALDPAAGDEGSIGATVATASAGPLANSFGTPRDLVLGVEFVMSSGAIARGGGRVVKNVAGFDLTRLLTGSWGTLGVITEVTVRLHARPEADESYAIAFDDDRAVERTRRLLRRLPFAPYACELVNPALASGLIGTEQTAVVVRLGGNAEAVRAQYAALCELGDPRRMDNGVWERLRDAERADSMVFRMSGASSAIQQTWAEASAMARATPRTFLHASPMRGVVRCIVSAKDAPNAALARAFRGAGAKCIGERLPADLWPLISNSAAHDALSIGIRQRFDPAGILNAGILGDIA